MKNIFFLLLILFSSLSVQAQLSPEKKNEFNKIIKDADMYFSQNKFLDAKNLYEKALELDPSNNYAISQRDKSISNSKGDTKEKESENYQKLIKKADEKFNATDYQNARDLYQRALSLKPNDPYPKKKIDEIDAMTKAQNSPPAKSEPLPDLGVSTKINDTEAIKLLNNEEFKRQKNKTNEIESKVSIFDNTDKKNREEEYKKINVTESEIKEVTIKNLSVNVEMKKNNDSNNIFIENKQQQHYENLIKTSENQINNSKKSVIDIADKSHKNDSTLLSTKTNPVEFDIYLTLRITRATDSLRVFDKKNKEEMIYRIDELNHTLVKNEKSFIDAVHQSNIEKQTGVDSSLLKIADKNTSNLIKNDSKIQNSKKDIENTEISNNDINKTLNKSHEEIKQSSEKEFVKDLAESNVILKKSSDKIDNTYKDLEGQFKDINTKNNSNLNTQYDNKQQLSDKIEQYDGKLVLSNFVSPNSIGSTYPEGITEESFRQNDERGLAKAIVTRRIVVVNGHGSVYVKTMTKEAITFSKDGQPITEHVWQIETQNSKLKKN